MRLRWSRAGEVEKSYRPCSIRLERVKQAKLPEGNVVFPGGRVQFRGGRVEFRGGRVEFQERRIQLRGRVEFQERRVQLRGRVEFRRGFESDRGRVESDHDRGGAPRQTIVMVGDDEMVGAVDLEGGNAPGPFHRMSHRTCQFGDLEMFCDVRHVVQRQEQVEAVQASVVGEDLGGRDQPQELQHAGKLGRLETASCRGKPRSLNLRQICSLPQRHEIASRPPADGEESSPG
eukprot:754545-Hanusia_phi.AAC.1